MRAPIEAAPVYVPGRVSSRGNTTRRKASTACPILGLIRVAFQSGQRNVAPEGNIPSASDGKASGGLSAPGSGTAGLNLSFALASGLFFSPRPPGIVSGDAADFLPNRP